MAELHLHIHIHADELDNVEDEMNDRYPRMNGQPYVLETPLLGAPVRPKTIIGQWGMEAPPIVSMTPPWMEQKPDGDKPVKVVPLCRPDWVAVPRQFARSA